MILRLYNNFLHVAETAFHPSTTADIIASTMNTVSRGRRPGQAPKARSRTLAGFEAQDRERLISLVCNQFCKGLRVSQILASLKEQGIDITREQPYEILRWAAEHGRLQYCAPLEAQLSHRILEEHPWLKRARVVRSAESNDVALQTAKLLVEILRKWKSPELHVGFAGGTLMAETVRLMTGLLRTPEPMPVKRLFVHSLMAAAYDPRRSPNSFLQWFLDPDLPFETTFVGLPAPGVVNSETLRTLRSIEGVAEAFDRAREIDIVLTSAGAHWGKGCSALHGLYESRPKDLRALNDAGCIGDVLWQPINADGQIDLRGGARAVTVVDLPALRQLVAAGKHVVLALAPCGSCRGPKAEVLGAVLRWEGAISDLVVDSHTAVEFFRSAQGAGGA
jgi:DNA-binding transcriptional regulator LsrR (DeoR family)